MHELSIAEAIFDQAERHTPAGGVLRSVTVLAGPLRGIDPQALAFAWQSLSSAKGLSCIRLDLRSPLWKLSCRVCRAEWESEQLDAVCGCGRPGVPVGGDELLLLSIDVDLPDDKQE